MDNLIFLIFIIVVFLLQAIGQVLKRREKQIPQEERPAEKGTTLEDILETLGLPPMEKRPAEEPPIKEEPLEILAEEKPEVREKEEREEVREGKVLCPATPEIEQEFLSPDKLEKAIIYSTVIGPPKAYQFRRSGEIGRHA